MNREILFRGKRKDNGEWVYGDLICNSIKDEPHIFFTTALNEINNTISNVVVIPDTIGQYTGLKDKNGKRIFEGDILQLTIPDGSVRHFTVEWAEENRTLMSLRNFEHDGNPIRISGWCFNWNGYRLYPSVIDGMPDNERMEIKGNIHDNPKLLE